MLVDTVLVQHDVWVNLAYLVPFLGYIGGHFDFSGHIDFWFTMTRPILGKYMTTEPLKHKLRRFYDNVDLHSPNFIYPFKTFGRHFELQISTLNINLVAWHNSEFDSACPKIVETV